MGLSSASTFTDAQNQYLDNLSYEGNINTTINFMAAVRAMLRLIPSSQDINGKSYTFDAESLRGELNRAEKYYDTIKPNGSGFTKCKSNHWQN